MKIVIDPGSFKDSLSAAEVASAIELGLQEVFPDAELVKCPMADGGEGTSCTFGRQKGASREQIRMLDRALAHFADCCQSLLGEDHRDFPGSGAAGGIGFTARAFFKAGFRPGIEMVAELTQLARKLEGAGLVITGEGRFDAQTLRGKPPLGVARQRRVPVIVLAGIPGEGVCRYLRPRHRCGRLPGLGPHDPGRRMRPGAAALALAGAGYRSGDPAGRGDRTISGVASRPISLARRGHSLTFMYSLAQPM